MKKITTLLALLTMYVSYGQMPTITFDATNAVNMGESIATALDQLDKLEEMTKYYEKAQDQIQKVNKVILKLEEIRNIAKMHRDVINDVNKVKNKISQIKDADTQKYKIEKLSTILTKCQKITQELSTVTKDNYLNMTDKERMDFVKEKEKEMRIQRATMRMAFDL